MIYSCIKLSLISPIVEPIVEVDIRNRVSSVGPCLDWVPIRSDHVVTVRTM